MSSYKLIYFDLKGRANVCRMMFHLAGVEFENYMIKFEDWPKVKPTLPFEQAPVLEVVEDSKKYVIAQTQAINRFLANRFGFAGKNEFEKAQVDMIDDQIMDILTLLIGIYRQPDAVEKKASIEQAMSQTVPHMLKLIQNILEKNGTGFLVGDSLTMADLNLFTLYDWLRNRRGEVLEKLPLLKEHEQRLRDYPKLGEFIKATENDKVTILFDKNEMI